MGQVPEQNKAKSAVQHELITELQTNPVEYRRFIKQAMEGHLGAFGLILMMRAPDHDNLPLHADALVWLANLQASLYPEGSETDGTIERIWTNPDQFRAESAKAAELAGELKTAVDGGNRHLILNSMVRLGEHCEQCHARYRIENE
jgi:cytochrome c556